MKNDTNISLNRLVLDIQSCINRNDKSIIKLLRMCNSLLTAEQVARIKYQLKELNSFTQPAS